MWERLSCDATCTIDYSNRFLSAITATSLSDQCWSRQLQGVLVVTVTGKRLSVDTLDKRRPKNGSANIWNSAAAKCAVTLDTGTWTNRKRMAKTTIGNNRCEFCCENVHAKATAPPGSSPLALSRLVHRILNNNHQQQQQHDRHHRRQHYHSLTLSYPV